LDGYAIPKGAVVLCNLGAIMGDPKVFTKPDNFDPERYLSLDKNGKLAFKPHPKYWIKFGQVYCIIFLG